MSDFGLCGNPDCGAILDAPGARFRDLYERCGVRLCPTCAAYVEREKDPRYERLEPLQQRPRGDAHGGEQ